MDPLVTSLASESFVTPWQMWVTIGAIAVAIVIYSLEHVEMELTSAGIIVFFTMFFALFPYSGPMGALTTKELLSGFANPALIAILALLIVGQGLFQAGALEKPSQAIIHFGRQKPWITLIGVLVLIAVVSAFLNNTPVAVMFIPIVMALAQRTDQVPSKVLMPLTYMCVLGGMTTLVGSSTNLLVAQAAKSSGAGEIGFFDITGMGVILAAVGSIYVLFILPRWLPSHGSMARNLVGDSKQYIAEIELVKGHPLIGAKPVGGTFKELPDIKVRMIQRGDRQIEGPFEEITLLSRDVLVVSATRNALTQLLSAKSAYLKGMITRHADQDQFESPDEDVKIANDLVVTEAVIAPGSRLVGYGVDHISFRLQTKCIVLGIQRRSRMYRVNLQDVRLEAGDVLLLLGRQPAMKALRANRDLMLMEWAMIDIPNLKKAGIARAIFLSVVGLAALNVAPIAVTAIAGALVMILTGCINTRQAARAIDKRIFLLIAAAIAMGTALEFTGGALFFANTLVDTLAGASPAIVVSAFFLLVAITTNILSNNATAILFTPIALGTAQQLGVDPMVFVFATIFAANCSFATPMGYQTNLLVMGPGQYTFRDFMLAGIPLMIIVWITFSLVAPWYFDLA